MNPVQLLLALLGFVGMALAQGVTDNIAPKGTAPRGCAQDAAGTLWVTVTDVVSSTKEDNIVKRNGFCTKGHLVVTLVDGILTDSLGRTGYIASNFQFQFDAPAQAGALFTAGFSLCGNGSLALGPTTTFYKCRSGNFWNLYDRSWAAQCDPVQLAAFSCDDAETGSELPGADQISDGQIVATEFVTTTIVKPIDDGQPQVVTTTIPVPMCQIGDGQVQAQTTPCASVTLTPPEPTTAVPVSEFSDGQVQVTTPAVPVSEISDGQVQVTTPAVPVSEISDGQVQVTMPASSDYPESDITTFPTIIIPTDSTIAVPTGDIQPSETLPVDSPTPSELAESPTASTIVEAKAGHLKMGLLGALSVGLAVGLSGALLAFY